MIRFLLPCTADVDRRAIDAAIELAHSCGATLVPLSLQHTAKIEEVGIEPEPRLSQHNFLAIVQRRAAIMEVPLEGFEIATHDAGRSIHLFAEEMNCSGILLFVREGKGILLETNEIQYVIKHKRIILPFLTQLIPGKKTSFPLSWIFFQRKKFVNPTPQKKQALPPWYPFAQLAVCLIIAALTILNAIDLLKDPAFIVISLLIKIIFICVITLSLSTVLAFFVEEWQQKQE